MDRRPVAFNRPRKCSQPRANTTNRYNARPGCGTSIGVGSMKPDSDIEVEIAGIGTLRNRFG